MLPTHQHVKTYKGYEIHQRKPGFEFTPITLGKIASFIVRQEDGNVAVFAFMYSMLTTLEDETLQEDDLLASAVTAIEAYIDDDVVRNGQELTFEYRSSAWVIVSSPRWWIESLP